MNIKRSVIEKTEEPFALIENPILEGNYSYELYNVIITSKPRSKIINSSHDNVLSALIICYEYQFIYELVGVEISYLFKSGDKSFSLYYAASFYTILSFFEKNPSSDIEIVINEAEDMNEPHFIIAYIDTDINDLKLKRME